MITRFERANAIRLLSVDAVEKAQSGHPGMPLGMADIAEVLWHDFLKHNPQNPKWINRDRFILSNGHGSMLQYALLHLTGYPLTLDDLKQFRQLHSKTPGHPEFGVTPGIEATTGPLGQGLANAIGMAIAERKLAAEFNRDSFNLIDHHIYVFVGDGCLMEGISHEACSLAGALGLNHLVVIWDNNGISIDGEVKEWFRDNTPERFRAYGWHVISPVDGHDPESIQQALLEAKAVSDKPVFIDCKTVIGYGSPGKAGSASCHGSPLGAKEISALREKLHWPYPPFEIPEEILKSWNAIDKGQALENEWNQIFKAYSKAYPELAKELNRRLSKTLPAPLGNALETLIKQLIHSPESMATRKASLKTLEVLGPIFPEFIGGSADLTESNLTAWSHCSTITPENPAGNYLHYGVREFGMSALMNGMSLYGGCIPYGGTFLAFYSYAASAVRMAALMKQRVIFIYSHDSIGLGEDGPTHQPVEQLVSLRSTPHVAVWRPCDAVETAIAWEQAIENTEGPTALILTRQSLPPQISDEAMVPLIRKGGYILVNCKGDPELILMATGSEVSLAVQAARSLQGQGIRVRVVSLPCLEVFQRQSLEYQNLVLPQSVEARIAIEAGASLSWFKWIGTQGRILGLDEFGFSAPAKDLFNVFHFTVEQVVNTGLALLN